MIDVFHQAEDLESLVDLHALFGCMQTIRKSRDSSPSHLSANPDCATAVLLNEHSLYEHILDDEIFQGVVGILECPCTYPSSCTSPESNRTVQTTQNFPTTRPTTAISSVRPPTSISPSPFATTPYRGRSTILTDCSSSKTSCLRVPSMTRPSTY